MPRGPSAHRYLSIHLNYITLAKVLFLNTGLRNSSFCQQALPNDHHQLVVPLLPTLAPIPINMLDLFYHLNYLFASSSLLPPPLSQV